jgi:hypothetical protein
MSKRVVGSDEPVELDRPEVIVQVEAAPEPARYQALMTLWLSVEGRHVYPGETVDLSHFDAATLADFVERGFVKRVV